MSQERAKEHRTLLRADNVSKVFVTQSRSLLRRKPQLVRAVSDVSLYLRRKETLGLVGESGCGKSTLGRVLVKLLEPTSGRIRYADEDITLHSGAQMRPLRRKLQFIFQDPFASLNPRLTIGDSIAEGLDIHGLAKGAARNERIGQLLQDVGLRPEMADRFPHELSGGQRQRVGIARALAVQPEVIVCDEPLSALDVSVQAQIVNLLHDLQERLGVAYLFISHDLKVVQYFCHRVAVMYLGRIVETAPSVQLYEKRYHPYTGALLAAIPSMSGKKRSLEVLAKGELPSPLSPPTGCSFHPRCPHAVEGKCDTQVPELREVEPGSHHRVACFFPQGAPAGRKA